MMRPLNTARASIVENALVELVARAVRHRVIDRRVVVDELRAVAEVDAVERAVRALAAEARHQVVADDAPAQGERPRVELAGRAALDAQGRHVERRRRLPLVGHDVHERAVAEPHVRHGVGQVHRIAGPDERLRQADAAARAGEDQVRGCVITGVDDAVVT
jgi:hypothetical protein